VKLTSPTARTPPKLLLTCATSRRGTPPGD
jgi:hypothetical protein